MVRQRHRPISVSSIWEKIRKTSQKPKLRLVDYINNPSVRRFMEGHKILEGRMIRDPLVQRLHCLLASPLMVSPSPEVLLRMKYPLPLSTITDTCVLPPQVSDTVQSG